MHLSTKSRVGRLYARMLMSAVVLTGTAAAAVILPAAPAQAYATSAIADRAETYADNSYGGQCKAFVGNVVRAVTGSYPPGYQQGFANAGAAEVTNPALAVRGDIIQITPAGSTDSTAESMYNPNVSSARLHTAIIRASRNADGTFNVIDSNWGSNELVRRHAFNPYSWASGSIVKIWRFGTAAPGGGGGGTVDSIDEIGFVRSNHSSGRSELVAFHGSPYYGTLKANHLTGYPAITDPQNVKSLAIDVNADGIDELAFVRTNHFSGQTEIVVWHGAPHYNGLLYAGVTGYPAISDPQNVTVLAIDVNGDGYDELGFVRTNHSSGRTELVVYHGAPHYTALYSVALTGYPAITDPQNVTVLAIDVNGDRIDELAFVRTNHWSGRSEIVVWHGSPHYNGLLHAGTTGYPAISDPQNVRVIALDTNGDRIDELAFARTNHYSGNTEMLIYHGSPHYGGQLVHTLTGYPAISDPQNVTLIALRLP